MLSAEQNDRITLTGPQAPAGTLLRRYWQPAALVDELAGNRPVKPVRLMGEDLVLFRDERGLLETQHKVVKVPHHVGFAPQPRLDHALEPQIEQSSSMLVTAALKKATMKRS